MPTKGKEKAKMEARIWGEKEVHDIQPVSLDGKPKEKGVLEVFQCKKLKIKRQRQKIHLVKAFRCKLKHNYQSKLNQRHHLGKGFQCRKVHLYKHLYLLFQIKGLPPQVLAALRWSKSKIPVKP